MKTLQLQSLLFSLTLLPLTLGFAPHHNYLQLTQLQATIAPDEISPEESAATLKSITLANVDKDNEPDLLCDFLMELGACSTAIIDADRGTDLETPLFGEFDTLANRDPWQDSLRFAAPIWDRCNVTAQFPASIDLKGVVELIGEVFPDQYPLEDYNVEQVPNKDWVVHVQKSWKPIVIGPFVLSFPWHKKEDLDKVLAGEEDSKDDWVELKLQGGVAFGTGEHPTTQLCLEWLHQQIKSSSGPITVMDYGAGSGVLGMAACALARERVTAVGVDIDVDAIRIANTNARDNNVEMKNYLPPLVDTADAESKSLLLKAHAHAQKQLGKQGSAEEWILPADLSQPTYDITVANILAGPLCALASTLAALTKPEGKLAMSGILPPQADAVIEAYSEYFDNVQLERRLGDWVLVTGTRKAE